jgi:hypothetical protein
LPIELPIAAFLPEERCRFNPVWSVLDLHDTSFMLAFLFAHSHTTQPCNLHTSKTLRFGYAAAVRCTFLQHAAVQLVSPPSLQSHYLAHNTANRRPIQHATTAPNRCRARAKKATAFGRCRLHHCRFLALCPAVKYPCRSVAFPPSSYRHQSCSSCRPPCRVCSWRWASCTCSAFPSQIGQSSTRVVCESREQMGHPCAQNSDRPCKADNFDLLDCLIADTLPQLGSPPSEALTTTTNSSMLRPRNSVTDTTLPGAAIPLPTAAGAGARGGSSGGDDGGGRRRSNSGNTEAFSSSGGGAKPPPLPSTTGRKKLAPRGSGGEGVALPGTGSPSPPRTGVVAIETVATQVSTTATPRGPS